MRISQPHSNIILSDNVVKFYCNSLPTLKLYEIKYRTKKNIFFKKCINNNYFINYQMFNENFLVNIFKNQWHIGFN